MDSEVGAAVSEAYRVFSRYSFGAGRKEPEADTLGPLEDRLLRVTPLSEAPRELLSAHAASLAAEVEGSAADDFRALLPRYFEVIAIDGYAVTGWKKDALRGLGRAQYRMRWPAEETTAVDRFLAALLKAAEARGGADDIATIRGFIAETRGEA